MDGSIEVPQVEEIFHQIAKRRVFLPFVLVTNKKNPEKTDKIPNNGYSNVSTKAKSWLPYADAWALKEAHGLPGVCLNMTGGIHYGELTLIGFDFDDITADWSPPFATYAEYSPSGKGARSFAWVKTDCAKRYQDTTDTHPPHCGHCEVYLGTAPRHLTLTGVGNAQPITTLKGKDLLTIESWGLQLYEEKTSQAAPDYVGDGKILDLSKYPLTTDQKKLVAGAGQPEIDRNKVFMGFGINLFDHGASQEDVLATITQPGPLWAYCLSHRNDNEDKALIFAREEIANAWGKSMPGLREKAGLSKGLKTVTNNPIVKTDDLKFPMEVFNKAPGLVGEIARWVLSASYVPREEFAYAAALSMMACLIGPYCTHGASTRKGKLNLYLTLVGGSGTGKTEAIGGMGLLLAETDAKDCILDFPASEAAMRRQLTLTPNLLLKVDEIAHKLDGMKDNTNGSSMGRAILEGYDGDRMPPKVYADSKNNLPAVENPFVQILGGTTDKVWEVVRKSHLDDGTLNRFVFVCLVEEPEYRHNPEPNGTVPKDLKDRLNTFWRKGRMSDLVGDVPGWGRHITYDGDVKKALDDLDKAMWDLQQEEFGNLYPRITQNTMKIASILAIGDGRETVAMRDFEQAQKFMKWSVANTHYKISGTMADNGFERIEKRIVRFLQKAGGKLRENELCGKMHMLREDLMKVLNTMDFNKTLLVSAPEKNANETESVWVSLL